MKRLVGSLIVLLTPLAAAAQPVPAGALRELSLEQLGRIEVTTVSKQPAEIWRSPAAIAVLTAEDIRRSGAMSLPEMLRLVPGLQVSRLDSGHWAVAIRGLASAFSKSLLVLIDGRSVYTPLFGGVFWQTQDTLIEDIERIEVIRGPGGTIWGANAVNGVINVITKSSRDTVGMVATVGGGSVDQGRAAFRYGVQQGDSVHFRVYGSGVTRDALYHTDKRPFDEWRLGQAGARLDAAAWGGTFTVQGDLYKGRAGDRVVVGSFAPPAQLDLEGPDHISGANVLARWQRNTASGGGLRVQAYYDRTAHSATQFGEIRHTLDIDVLHDQPLGRRHHVSWGAGARRSPADFTTKYPGLTLARPDRGHSLLSVFAQDELAVIQNRLWLTVGSKFEHNNNTGMEVQPSARLLWRPDARQSAWAAATRAVRTPAGLDTDLRLYGYAPTNPPIYPLVAGTADFESERLIGFEAGYRRLLGAQLYVDVAAFHNDYDDLAGFSPIAFSAQTDPFPHVLARLSYENAVRGTTHGFEIAPDWRPADWLQIKAAYSLVAIDMTSKDGYADASSVTLYQENSPRHQGYARMAMALPRQIALDLTTRLASELRSGRVPAYATADVRVEVPLADRFSVAVAGYNLLQPHHVEFIRDAVPPIGVPRSIYASLTWRR